ncbi:type I DNA topoisomerase [Blattabacterium cuenoti]|uniref:type I DNA topoisomerase n=1 Tax=Blattabacterium cuenoti TaxID=1653831 RepID=UPI00163CF7AD|nr:type I DNA topoisomerase [Blattabacterium cuenoti]
MPTNLVIVESPTKAKTIQKFLGKNYYVVPSYGHIIDLPEKKIGIQINNNFKPNYVILSKKIKVVKELKKLIKNYKFIWLATDEDREGEAIAHQIQKTFIENNKKYKRIVFHEITKKSIFHAIKNPRELNFNLIYSQQARRILDRIVGFLLSPLLWKKIKKGLSAGRVQSIAVRLIVEREQKIKNHIPVKTYKITGSFIKDKEIIYANFSKNLKNKKEVKSIMDLCINTKYFKIKEIIENNEKKSPSPPFTTSSLQQESCNRLNFSISKTMFIAQSLYEKGYITYMRTDSQKLSEFIISKIKNFICSNYGIEYLSVKNFSNSNKFSQESHEAIRPTVIDHNDDYLKDLNSSENILYQLIWERTIMGQMKDVIFRKKNFHIQFSDPKNFFIATEKYIIFDGYTKVKKKIPKKIIPLSLKKGNRLYRKEIIATSVIKNNSYRYNEATLVKNLENLGIGRPSTYVPIISTIQKRDYVNIQKIIKKKEIKEIFLLQEKKKSISKIYKEFIKIEKNRFVPTEMGILITNFLKNHFYEIINYNFTENLEKKLDSIAKGTITWIEVIKDFYNKFEKIISHVQKNVKKVYEKRLLGKEPKSNQKIYVMMAKFGPVIQLGDFNKKNKNRPKFFPLLNSQKLETISLKETLKMIDLPKKLGLFNNKEIYLKINKYNIYIKYDNQIIPIKKEDFFNSSITLNNAINIINNNNKNKS